MNNMISPVYDSFVNGIVCELFGFGKKKESEKPKSEEKKFNPSESLIKSGMCAAFSTFKAEWNDTSSIPFNKVFKNFSYERFSKYKEAYHEIDDQYRYVYYFSDEVIKLCNEYSNDTDGFTPVGVEIIYDSDGFDKESGNFLY